MQYNGKKMKKYVNLYMYIDCHVIFYIRLEKEYTVIHKEEQEEQIEIRVWIFYLILLCQLCLSCFRD
jgi:hypothetical protein